MSYKRLTKTFTVPPGGGEMNFWTSYNTEGDWDFTFVEAHNVGQDNWTTLPDLNGHTGTTTGQSCPSGWNALHPFIDHYQTFDGVGACTGTGTSGSWNAASGDSHGWQNWRVSFAGFAAGSQVEVSISYVSDWATQGLGVFVDDVTLPGGVSTSFEDGSRRLGDARTARRKRTQREHVPADHCCRVPRGRGYLDPRHDLHGLRLRGHLGRRDPQCGHGSVAELPAASVAGR